MAGDRVLLILFLLLFPPLPSMAKEEGDTARAERPTFWRRVGKGIGRFFNEFNTYDTLYIEPQHFKFQALCQFSEQFEQYTLSTKSGQRVVLSPETQTSIGPYVGYSLIFLGYTLQLNNLHIGSAKKTFNLSLYSSLLGVDFYYRNNHEFNIKRFDVPANEPFSTSALPGTPFDDFHVKYWGFNTYYLFNHRRHSYPAVYNESTCQKRSAGSPIVGFGYGHYTTEMDWASLDRVAAEALPAYRQQFTGEALMNNIRYDCYSLYGGYSYNWVFARNFTLGASFTAAVSYNSSSGEASKTTSFFDDFNISSLTFDGVGRMGVVWNNKRLFAGAMGQIHSYTYSKQQFKLNNLFANVNVYVGVNFGKKKPYRKPGRFFEM